MATQAGVKRRFLWVKSRLTAVGGAGVIRLAAVSLLLFLTPITFIVHDFWSISKYAGTHLSSPPCVRYALCTYGVPRSVCCEQSTPPAINNHPYVEYGRLAD